MSDTAKLTEWLREKGLLIAIQGMLAALLSWLGFITLVGNSFYFSTNDRLDRLEAAEKATTAKIETIERNHRELVRELKMDLTKAVDALKADTDKHFLKVERSIDRLGAKIDNLK